MGRGTVRCSEKPSQGGVVGAVISVPGKSLSPGHRAGDRASEGVLASLGVWSPEEQLAGQWSLSAVGKVGTEAGNGWEGQLGAGSHKPWQESGFCGFYVSSVGVASRQGT